MASEDDYYELLGVPRDASLIEIQRAYHGAARELHPDLNPEESRKKFAAVAEAYRILRDPELRAEYDRTGKAGNRRPDKVLMRIADLLLRAVREQGDARKGLLLILTEEKEQVEAAHQHILKTAAEFKQQARDYRKANANPTEEADLLIEMLENHANRASQSAAEAEAALEHIQDCLDFVHKILPVEGKPPIWPTHGGSRDGETDRRQFVRPSWM